MGVGRVNAYSAVEMAADMQAVTGIVKVQDRVLDRFDYDLRTNPYAILMTNNKVTGNTTIDFTAKNYIDTASGDYNPGAGWIDFKINVSNTECNTPVQNRYMANMTNGDPENSIRKLNAKLYPNPNSGKFTVLFDKKVPGVLQMSIADVLGKIVYSGTSDELSSADINVPYLPSGVYFLRLTAEGYNQTIKFVKQ